MPKPPKSPPNPIERISPGDLRLPPALQLAEAVDAEVLPDGRVVPLSLPPAVRALYFADLSDAPSPIGTDVAPVSAPAPQDAAPAVADEETPAEPSDAAQDAPETTPDVPPPPAVEEV